MTALTEIEVQATNPTISACKLAASKTINVQLFVTRKTSNGEDNLVERCDGVQYSKHAYVPTGAVRVYGMSIILANHSVSDRFFRSLSEVYLSNAGLPRRI